MTLRRTVVPVGFAVFLVGAALAGVAGGYATGSMVASSPGVAASTGSLGAGASVSPTTSAPVTTVAGQPVDVSRPRCLALRDVNPMLGVATSLVGALDPDYNRSLRRAVGDLLPASKLRVIEDIQHIAEDSSPSPVPILLAPYATRSGNQAFMDKYQGAVAVYFQAPADFRAPVEPTSYAAVLLVVEPNSPGDFTSAKFLIAHLIQHGSSVCERLPKP